MPPRRRGHRQPGSSPTSPDETPPPPSKRQRSKAAKQRFKELRQRVSAWVNTDVNPRMQQLALEFDVPVEDVRELAHLVLPAAAKQRRVSLWQTVVSVAREEGADNMEEASRNASEIYARLQAAIAEDDFDNEELVMYELRREELNTDRDLPKVPKTSAKADRAVIADVTRGGEEIVNTLHVLRDSSAIEFCVFICPGNDRISFPPHIYTTPKVTDFFKLKTKIDPTLFGQELAGYTQHGSKVYEMLAVNDPKHRKFVAELLNQQLCEATGNPKAKMAYVKYDEMCSKYGIKIEGWPQTIPFQSMERTTYGNAQKLHMLIRDGTLRVVRTDGTNPPTADPATSAASASSTPSTAGPNSAQRPARSGARRTGASGPAARGARATVTPSRVAADPPAASPPRTAADLSAGIPPRTSSGPPHYAQGVAPRPASHLAAGGQLPTSSFPPPQPQLQRPPPPPPHQQQQQQLLHGAMHGGRMYEQSAASGTLNSSLSLRFPTPSSLPPYPSPTTFPPPSQLELPSIGSQLGPHMPNMHSSYSQYPAAYAMVPHPQVDVPNQSDTRFPAL